ncbi:MAG: hypothetical protein K6E48_08955 [Lachnospiraceae bacterium]|nr:hypothetical protein [Lachnospiraceae bacterium]
MKKQLIIVGVVVILVVVLCGVNLSGGKNKDSREMMQIAESEAITDSQQSLANEETTEESTEETVAETVMLEAPAELATAPDIDITGCDTFTQIVDRKLEAGMGYANVTIGEEDVLLVSSGTFDNGDNLQAAIDATVFIYENCMPKMIGKISCGGTAYPLAVKDGLLYSAGGHFVQTNTVEDGRFQLYEHNWEEFDEDGNVKYFYESSEGQDEVTSEVNLQNMFEDYEAAETIGFTVVVK